MESKTAIASLFPAVFCLYVSSMLCGLPGFFPGRPLFDRLTAADRILSAAVLSFVISGLHHLFHKCSHLFRRFILCLPCGVGVGAEGEACVVVSQHSRYRFYVYAVLQSHGREGMALRYNNDKRKKP